MCSSKSSGGVAVRRAMGALFQAAGTFPSRARRGHLRVTGAGYISHVSAADSSPQVGPDYPAHWEADVVLRDGRTAHLRPITPDDAEALVAFYEEVSAQSKYFRFFAPMPHLSDKDVRRFTNVDHRARVAFVLTVAEKITAIASYELIE